MRILMYDFKIIADSGVITYIYAKCRKEAIEIYCREKGCSEDYVKNHCIIKKDFSGIKEV